MAAALLCYPILVTGTIFTSICAAFIAARTEAHNHHITWQFMWWVVAWIYTSSYGKFSQMSILHHNGSNLIVATTISFALSPLPSWPSIAAGMIALSIILLLSEFTFHLFTTVRGKSLTLGSFGTMHSMIWGSLGKRWEGLQMSWEGLGALLHQVVGVFFGRHHATNLTSDNPAQASMLPPPYEVSVSNFFSMIFQTHSHYWTSISLTIKSQAAIKPSFDQHPNPWFELTFIMSHTKYIHISFLSNSSLLYPYITPIILPINQLHLYQYIL